MHRDTCHKMLSQAEGPVASYAIELFSYVPGTTRGLSRHQDIYLPFSSAHRPCLRIIAIEERR